MHASKIVSNSVSTFANSTPCFTRILYLVFDACFFLLVRRSHNTQEKVDFQTDAVNPLSLSLGAEARHDIDPLFAHQQVSLDEEVSFMETFRRVSTFPW